MNRDVEQINSVYSKFKMTVTECVEGLRINKYKLLITDYSDVSKYASSKMQKNLVAALCENLVKLYLDQNYVVIEKKNNSNTTLTMHDVFFKSLYTRNNDLRLVLGKDIEGHTISTSLSKAPHILVSGCTGSGKTVLLHSFISSLLVGNDTCHLILIDPKGNEFNVYKDIETVEFIDNVKNAIDTLSWLVTEMNGRYKKMQELGTTDINDTRFCKIVCVIDEFADLIETDRNIEKNVVLLAQKSRGCGIHLIIGTQYPKVDVLTGLIQANVPTRVCLKVNNNIQSRVAINCSGGEKLLGHGDLLFLGNGMYEPLRIQAPFISSSDKATVVEIAKKTFAGKGGYILERKHINPQINDSPKYYSQPTYQTPPTYNKPIFKDTTEPMPAKKTGFFQGIKNILSSEQTTTPAQFINLIIH